MQETVVGMNKKIAKWFYAVLAFGICVVVGVMAVSSTQKVAIDNEKAVSFNEGWHYSVNDGGVNENQITLPYRIDARKADKIYLYNTLPSEYPDGMTICFRSSNQYVRVLADNQEVYSFGYDDIRPFGKSPGSVWNIIRLKEDTAGRDIVIELCSPYETRSGIAASVYYGSKSANVFRIFSENILGFSISTIIIFIALLLFISYFFVGRNVKITSLLYLAWFALLVGLWFMAEARIAQVVVNSQFLLMLCSCIAMMLWPVPLLLFITETHSFHNKKPFNILAGLFLTNFVVLMMLQIFNIVDLIESIFVTILLLIICIVFFVFDILVEIIKYKNRDIYLLGLGTSVFISLSLIDLVRYYSKIGADNSMFSRFGVLFYILILGYYAVKQLMNMMSQNIDTRMLEKLAFSDRLTGLQNRTAFETDMEPYRTDVACCEGLWIGIFDINNLKLVNDTQGHKMGDNAILTAVDCLKTAFNSRGRLYRIGGDEFALITENLTSGEAEELLKRFEKELESSRQEKCQTLSVAYGIAEFDPAADKTVDELYVRADSYMYHEKYKAKRYSIRSD